MRDAWTWPSYLQVTVWAMMAAPNDCDSVGRTRRTGSSSRARSSRSISPEACKLRALTAVDLQWISGATSEYELATNQSMKDLTI